jgi:hypothetical protein
MSKSSRFTKFHIDKYEQRRFRIKPQISAPYKIVDRKTKALEKIAA